MFAMLKSLSLPVLLTIATVLVLFIGSLVFGAGFYHYFLSIEGLVIVIGGCVANAFLSYRRENVLAAFANIRDLLEKLPSPRIGLHSDIMQFISWSYVVNGRDFIGLEKETAGRITDPLLRYGMDMVVTGYPAKDVREMMNTVAEAEFERRTAPVTVLRNMAATAPAFGMVGTLIGMVMTLHTVSSDFSGIESGLAIAMLATLYGILVARLVCLPAADKLLQKEENIYFRNQMLIEGLILLTEKHNPFYIQDRLNSFLEPARHFDLTRYEHLAFHRQFATAA